MWIAGLSWSSSSHCAQDFDEVLMIAKYHIEWCRGRGSNLVTLVPGSIRLATVVGIGSKSDSCFRHRGSNRAVADSPSFSFYWHKYSFYSPSLSPQRTSKHRGGKEPRCQKNFYPSIGAAVVDSMPQHSLSWFKHRWKPPLWLVLGSTDSTLVWQKQIFSDHFSEESTEITPVFNQIIRSMKFVRRKSSGFSRGVSKYRGVAR